MPLHLRHNAPIVLGTGKRVELTGSGFLVDPQDWSEAVRDELAARWGLKLDTRHLRLISVLRGHYQTFNRSPDLRELCKLTDLTLRELYAMFSDGLSGACRLAGVPPPRCG